ncbi:hypothetical protein R3P38DRAFT_617282 [Favolaschia claudopus]|uniref:Uncharacterized protein n=1 Tax=Favolaschia claudopus TaxID=2862362 RepID=A0AAW0CBB3_9AGAR
MALALFISLRRWPSSWRTRVRLPSDIPATRYRLHDPYHLADPAAHPRPVVSRAHVDLSACRVTRPFFDCASLVPLSVIFVAPLLPPRRKMLLASWPPYGSMPGSRARPQVRYSCKRRRSATFTMLVDGHRDRSFLASTHLACAGDRSSGTSWLHLGVCEIGQPQVTKPSGRFRSVSVPIHRGIRRLVAGLSSSARVLGSAQIPADAVEAAEL